MNTFEEVKDIISEHSGVEKEAINIGSHLQEDLNLDPLSITDIMAAIEEKFKIEIPKDNIVNLTSISDIVEFIEDKLEES